jgi:hypothetical protein
MSRRKSSQAKKRAAKTAKSGAPNTPKENERASPESEAKFPSHLSPIIQCKHSVLTFSKIEFYCGIFFGALVWVLPVNGVTRSLILFCGALAPLVDVAWRSPWSHAWLRVSKIRATVLLVGVYSVIAATMILYDHSSAAVAIKTYLSSHANGLFVGLYLFAGAAGFYLLAKLLWLVKRYARNRRTEKVAIQQRLRETPRGWLNYRLESEESSKRLHSLVARMTRAVRGMAFILKRWQWFVGKEGEQPHVLRAKATASLFALALDKCSSRLEPDLEDMEATANLFIESTEGHFKMATNQGDLQVAELHEYFQAQLKDVRDVANVFGRFPPAFERLRGTSQELNAALARQATIWRTEVAVLRKIEGHCAHMVKLTQAGFERALEKPLMELASKLVETAEMMAKDTNDEAAKEKVRQLRTMARSAGIKDKAT